MKGYESFGLLRMLVPIYFGCIGFFFAISGDLWGTVGTISQSEIGNSKRRRRIIRWVAFILGLPILFICLRLGVPMMMDLPGIMAGEYRSVEGRVTDYIYGMEEGGRAITGQLTVEDSSGKLYTVLSIHVPGFIEKGDRVKMDYRKYRTTGVIREINGTAFEEFGKRHWGLFRIITRYLLFSMPVYSFYMLKWRYKRDRKNNYSICIYHDSFVRSIWAVGILRLQSVVVMVMAVIGIYGIILEVYWGLLVSGNYLGIVCLSTLRNKKLILKEDKFYYRNFKQEVEGKIEEIEFVERRKASVGDYSE